MAIGKAVERALEVAMKMADETLYVGCSGAALVHGMSQFTDSDVDQLTAALIPVVKSLDGQVGNNLIY